MRVFKKLFLKNLRDTALLLVSSSAVLAADLPVDASRSAYCFRGVLSTLVSNEHRPLASVRPIKNHVLKTAQLYKGLTMKQQVDYLVDRVVGMDAKQAEYILKAAFSHPQASQKTRVVFGGSRVRGNATAVSDLDVGFSGLGNNPVTKILKKINDRVKAGEFKLHLEETKIYEGNRTASIPEIISPEEFFLRFGKRHPTQTGEISEFVPSGAISVGADGSLMDIPAYQTKE